MPRKKKTKITQCDVRLPPVGSKGVVFLNMSVPQALDRFRALFPDKEPQYIAINPGRVEEAQGYEIPVFPDPGTLMFEVVVGERLGGE